MSDSEPRTQAGGVTRNNGASSAPAAVDLREGKVRLLGRLQSPEAHDLRIFLASNHVPFEWIDVDGDVLARFFVEHGSAPVAKWPVCLLPDGTCLEAPSRLDLARMVGLNTRPSQVVCDVAIIGGGPAGLTAAVYAASEGLRTVVIERDAPGGQAGTSARIENYLGFPEGISGAELTDRALNQARKFGAEFIIANEAVSAEPGERSPFCLNLRDGSELRCQTAIIATGVSYRLLDVPGVQELSGCGVYYGATASEAMLHRGKDVFVVGGANSAGQAAVHLAAFARKVTMLVRGDSLEKSMSHYLVQQIKAIDNVEVRLQSQVLRANGDERLQELTVGDARSGTEERLPADALFIFIGQKPGTDWADGLLRRDAKGFILAGTDLVEDLARHGVPWPLYRDPFPLEASVPGVFVAGDVRSGSTKRVASAVGEGAMAVQLVHHYLSQIARTDLEALMEMQGAQRVAPEDMPPFLRGSARAPGI